VSTHRARKAVGQTEETQFLRTMFFVLTTLLGKLCQSQALK
jgi:hypothetical protein